LLLAERKRRVSFFFFSLELLERKDRRRERREFLGFAAADREKRESFLFLFFCLKERVHK
jgi:hypothetical protein